MSTPPTRRPLARWFVDPGGPRARRPLDVALLVVGVLVAALATQQAHDGGPVQDALVRVAHSLPEWAVASGRAAYALAALYAVLAVLAAVLSSWRHTPLTLTLLVALPLAAAGSVVTSLVVDHDFPGLVTRRSADSHWGEPVLLVAALTAGLIVLGAWMVEPMRRYDSALVLVLAIGVWATGTAEAGFVVAALAWGLAGAGAGFLVAGSPGGHPDLTEVEAALRALRVEVTGLRFAARQPVGARLLDGVSTSGETVRVKVYGRDATDAYRASRWWRTIAYRDQEIPGATRLQLVEHEALLLMLAERAGVAVPRVVAAAETGGDALLVLAPPAGTAVPDGDSVADESLVDIWRAVALLRAAGLAHGQLTLEHVSLVAGGVVLLDFDEGLVAAPQARLRQDVATLLTSSALRVGVDRAVEAAIAGLGADAVGDAQPYLQRAAMPRSLRGRLRKTKVVDDLRRVIGDRTGVPPPPPAPLARIKWQDLLRAAIFLLAGYALLTALVQLDWGSVLDAWAHATWAWIVVGLLVAQATTVCDSVTVMSAVRTRLPLLPLVHLQYAVKLVGLAVSATAGRAALTARFVSKFGERPEVGVTETALDSAAGSIANVTITVIFLLVDPDIASSVSFKADDVVRLLLLLAAAVVVSAVVVASVPRLRRAVLGTVGHLWDALRIVTESPARTALLLGSNFASLVVTALALQCMVLAIHPGPSFPEILAVAGSSGLIAALIPVPNNIGVGEAAIAATLGLVGVPSAPAFAIAVTQRIATSYLPPVIGSYSLRWLRREEYL